MYEMVRYHMGLDGSGSSGKRMRPLLGLLAYASITGEYAPALPGAAAVELGHNFSLIHDDIEDGDRERRHRRDALDAPRDPPGDQHRATPSSSSRAIALHRLTELGFSDAKVLRLMRLYDETCLALCEGQYIDIWTGEHDITMTVDLYFDMIGRKTAALISASIEAGALLATDDEEVITRYRKFGWALGLAFQLNDDVLGIWGQEQATGKEPIGPRQAQEDAPRHLRPGARGAGRPGAPRGASTPTRSPAPPRSPRRWRSSSGRAPRTTPGRRPGAGATRRSPSSTRPASSSPRRGRSSSRSCGASSRA